MGVISDLQSKLDNLVLLLSRMNSNSTQASGFILANSVIMDPINKLNRLIQQRNTNLQYRFDDVDPENNYPGDADILKEVLNITLQLQRIPKEIMDPREAMYLRFFPQEYVDLEATKLLASKCHSTLASDHPYKINLITDNSERIQRAREELIASNCSAPDPASFLKDVSRGMIVDTEVFSEHDGAEIAEWINAKLNSMRLNPEVVNILQNFGGQNGVSHLFPDAIESWLLKNDVYVASKTVETALDREDGRFLFFLQNNWQEFVSIQESYTDACKISGDIIKEYASKGYALLRHHMLYNKVALQNPAAADVDEEIFLVDPGEMPLLEANVVLAFTEAGPRILECSIIPYNLSLANRLKVGSDNYANVDILKQQIEEYILSELDSDDPLTMTKVYLAKRINFELENLLQGHAMKDFTTICNEAYKSNKAIEDTAGKIYFFGRKGRLTEILEQYGKLPAEVTESSNGITALVRCLTTPQ